MRKRNLSFFIQLILILLLLPRTAYAENEDFNKFVDKFVNKPFLLEISTPFDSRIRPATMSKNELRILRNAIFARHGYIFKNKDLREYFMLREWYQPLSKEIDLTDIDSANLSYISKLEKPREELYTEFLELFEEVKLPITISNTKYGSPDLKFIPFIYSEIYPFGCCPIRKAISKITMEKFVIVIIKTEMAGESIGIHTFTRNGKYIATKGIAKYYAGISGKSTSHGEITEDLEVIIYTNDYSNVLDKTHGKMIAKLDRSIVDRYRIDNGHFIKLNDGI